MTATPIDTSPERELWIRVFDDYKKAYSVVERVWPADTPPEVLVQATATVLNHHREVKRSMLPHNQPASVGNGQPTPPPACPDCEGQMYDNRGDKKNPRSPDFKCKDPTCGKAVWLTPPKGKARASA